MLRYQKKNSLDLRISQCAIVYLQAGSREALWSVVFTPRCRLKQSCFCWSASGASARTALEADTAVVYRRASTWQLRSVIEDGRLLAGPPPSSVQLITDDEPKRFLRIRANFLGSAQGLMKQTPGGCGVEWEGLGGARKTPTTFKTLDREPEETSGQDARDRNPIGHWREWGVEAKRFGPQAVQNYNAS